MFGIHLFEINLICFKSNRNTEVLQTDECIFFRRIQLAYECYFDFSHDCIIFPELLCVDNLNASIYGKLK